MEQRHHGAPLIRHRWGNSCNARSPAANILAAQAVRDRAMGIGEKRVRHTHKDCLLWPEYIRMRGNQGRRCWGDRRRMERFNAAFFSNYSSPPGNILEPAGIVVIITTAYCVLISKYINYAPNPPTCCILNECFPEWHLWEFVYQQIR